MTAAEKILAEMEANRRNYSCFGIRTDAGVHSVGDELECSRNFDTVCEEDDELLNGTCATGFGMIWYDGEQDDIDEINKALEVNARYDYPGSHKYLIGGYGFEYGNDEKEVIIIGAEVVAII